ncbi:unnamed protein product [Mytilus coruscus]|uniref:Uncharacterized protein n=1 Tax=Mytilus coruscus TaxID=42192 RepID=A0A6J8AYL4_MYTCO|nr:unnamed protein product [Mytilus coruscus]
MSNKKVLKGKLDYKDIFINEDLTMLRLKMLNMVKKHDNVMSVFTRDGKINCFLRNGRKKIIENPDDLFEVGFDSVDYSALGLSKLKAPELEELCSNYDIVCFCETKLDELDVVELDHFRLLPPLNRKNGKCKSGGIALCKSLELFIANGRLGKDSGIGALTCKEATVVDYCILSPELFTHVCEFKILPFDAMINGVHIEFMSTNKPNVGIQVNDVNKNGNVTVKPKWDNEKYQSFVDNLNDTEIDNICEKLNVLEVENIDKSVINNLVEDCYIIIRDAADASGLFNIICNNSVSGSRRKNKPNKPWFNRECFVKRKEYHRAKNYNWRVKTVESKNSMVRCSKAYKKALSEQFNSYRKNFIKKLRGLNQNDPKSYWSLINRSCNKNMKENVVNKVSLDCFLEHLKKLNTVVQNENDVFSHEIDTSNVTELNTELNSVITVEEVQVSTVTLAR